MTNEFYIQQISKEPTKDMVREFKNKAGEVLSVIKNDWLYSRIQTKRSYY